MERCSLNFKSGNLGNISSTFYVANDTEVGVLTREAAALSFSTLPENLWILLALLPLLPGVFKRLRKSKS